MNLNGNKLFKRYMALLLVVAAVMFIFNTATRAETGKQDEFEVVAENPYLSLLINRETAGVGIRDRATGFIWHTNPPDREVKEKKIESGTKGALYSQLSMTFYDRGDRMFLLDTYNDCVKKNQHKIIPIDQGVRVEFQLGEKWVDEDYVPHIIKQEKFEEEILKKLTAEEDREFLLEQYHLINLVEEEGSGEPLDIFGVDSKKLFGNYRLKVLNADLSERDQRRLIQDLLKKIVTGKDYSGLGNLKKEDLLPLANNPVYLLKSTVRAWDLPILIDLIMKVGYPPEEIQKDHEECNFRPPWPNIKVFSFAIEYKLEGEDLVVRIPGDSIEYPIEALDHDTGEKVTLPLTDINVLEYFTVGAEDEEGYIFVPDGSGALIHLNNGKVNARPYSKEVYGKDYTVRPIDELGPYLDEQIHMPVFGIKKKDQAVLAIIEEGESLAKIRAEVAGMRDSYNKVYASFSLIPKTQIKLRESSTTGDLSNLFLNVYQARAYQGDIAIRYRFFTGEQADYSGMARSYQRYLVKKYGLTKVAPQPQSPFFLELIGGIDKTVPVMGIPQRIIEPLTTYKQAHSILQELAEEGITNIKLKYTGWSAGGVRHNFPEKLRLEKKLGSDQDLAALCNNGYEGFELFPDISLLNVYKSSSFDGFSVLRESARFLSREQAFIYDAFNIATYRAYKDIKRYIYAPSLLDKLVTNFMSRYQRYQISGISLRFMGKQLNSGFQIKKERLLDREQVKEIIEKQLMKISQEYQTDILLDGGNFYTIPYAKYILNLPMYSDAYTILDEGIPFSQMVLHGYFHYSGTPINLASKPHSYLLKLIETGAAPYYQWSYESSSTVKKTKYDSMYSICYQDYLSEAVDFYRKADSLLAQVQDKRIVRHEKIRENVYKTLYESGSAVIVNYNQEAVEVNGETIQGLDFIMVVGGE